MDVRCLRAGRAVLLALICALAFVIRLFAVVRYEPIIHEYDPHFNYRATVLLVEQGPAALWNWFDSSVWYPLGRDVGSTVYPALPLTAAFCWWLSRAIGVPISLRGCCVYLPPVCSAITCVATYDLTRQVVRRGSHGAGLYAAAFVAIVPSYLSRSCAGAYDNECVAIPALVATFALYLRALNTPGGSILWASLSAVLYGYMVLAWGGHIFVVNLIAVHCLALLLFGRFTNRLYVTYSTWCVCAGLLAVQTPFVRGKIMGGSNEYIIAQFAFALVHVRAVVPTLESVMRSSRVQPIGIMLVVCGGLLVLLTTVRMTFIRDWADGRLRRLLDPTRTATFLVTSVSEHQTARWKSLFRDLHLLQILFPAGLILLLHGDCAEHCAGSESDAGGDKNSDSRVHNEQQRRRGHACERAGDSNNLECSKVPADAKIFAAMFGCFALYFNGIMERCSLIFAPVACVVSGIAANRVASIYAGKSARICHRCAHESTCCGGGRIRHSQGGAEYLESAVVEVKATSSNWQQVKSSRHQRPVLVELTTWLGSTTVVLALLALTCLFVQHAVWMAAVEFSSPSVVFAQPSETGVGAADAYVDDFREAYSWLRLNTPQSAKVLAWWDYGYQIAALANRTTFVDNNTWNHTAIAAVGRVLVSSEAEGARLMRQMGADFVLIVFGGVIGWPDDDIGKMVWPIRIASEVFPEAIRESDFLTGGTGGQLRMDSKASRAVKESLLVKCAYSGAPVYDRARMSHGPFGDPTKATGAGSSVWMKQQRQLRELREVYSTTNWVVRIFSVIGEPNRS